VEYNIDMKELSEAQNEAFKTFNNGLESGSKHEDMTIFFKYLPELLLEAIEDMIEEFHGIDYVKVKGLQLDLREGIFLTMEIDNKHVSVPLKDIVNFNYKKYKRETNNEIKSQ
jgi:hypothetical protein